MTYASKFRVGPYDSFNSSPRPECNFFGTSASWGDHRYPMYVVSEVFDLKPTSGLSHAQSWLKNPSRYPLHIRSRKFPASNSRRSKGLPTTNQLCSARVTRDYRVLGVPANDIVIWFWTGSHNNCERLTRELR
jgi:hypothetical protein